MSIGTSNPLDLRLVEVVAEHEAVEALYGMGSFFRGEPYNDVDFVVVLSSEVEVLVAEARAVRAQLRAVGDSV